MRTLFLRSLWLLCAPVVQAHAQTVYASTGRGVVVIDGRTDMPAASGQYGGLATLLDLIMAAGGSRLEIVSHDIKGADRVLDDDAVSLRQIGATEVRGPLETLVAAPGGQRLYAISDHSISIVDVAAHRVLDVINQECGTAKAAITPDGRTLYIAQIFGRDVVVFDIASRRLMATIAAGHSLGGIAMSRDGAHAYVSDQDGNALVVLDTATRRVEASVPVSGGPAAIVLTPDGRTAYVGQSDSAVSVVDLAKRRVIKSMMVSGSHLSLALSKDGTKLYAGDDRAGSLTVIDTRTNAVMHSVKLDASGVFAIATAGHAEPSRD